MRTSAGLLITTVVLCGVSHTLAFTSPFLWNARRCLASPQRSVDMKNPNGFALRSRPNCPVACQNSDTNEGKKEDGGTGDVFVLSFDGVLCDSVRETSRIAFEVACEQWPEEMGKSDKIKPREAGVRKSWVEYDWQEYEQDTDGGMPRWLQEKLRQLRPVTRSPADMVLAARLCVSEALAAKRSLRGQRPLSVGEIVENWEEMRDLLAYKYGAAPAELEAKFESRLAQGASAEAEGGDFYDGMVCALRGSRASLVVMSPRPTELTAQVMEAAGLELDQDRLSLLQVPEGGAADAVAHVIADMPQRGVQVVTDRLEELRAMASDLRLAQHGRVSLRFAAWGYSTPGQRAAVAGWPRVRAMEPQELQALLLSGTPE
mmetsp:Transcript_53626/g.126832  ORF Transcript_53626/g.126832 Transcript_53626/m.126832 type:complete len:374 (+) Transcript_53626:180-1301(+)